MDFGPTLTAAVAIGVALLFGVILVYFARKRMDRTSTNDRSTQEREEHRERVNSHLSSRQRWRLMSPPAKVLAVGLFVAFTVSAYEIYIYFKTGSPNQVLYSQYSVISVATLIGCLLGIKYGRGRMRSEGYLLVEFEATPDNERSESGLRVVPFDPDDAIETEDGLVVHEQTEHRIFGLWRRALTIIEHRELRGQSLHRPDEDKVAHLVPDRAIETRPNQFYFRTKGDRTVKDPDEIPDITYLPSYSMSNEEKSRYQADMDMILTDNKHLRVRLASAHQQLDRLEDEVEMLSKETRKGVYEEMEHLAEILGNGQQHYNYNQMQAAAAQGHRSRSRTNGSEPEGKDRVDRAIAVLNGEDE